MTLHPLIQQVIAERDLLPDLDDDAVGYSQVAGLHRMVEIAERYGVDVATLVPAAMPTAEQVHARATLFRALTAAIDNAPPEPVRMMNPCDT